MKTFWLYYGSKVVAAVRLKENSDDHDVRVHAKNQLLDHPTLNSLWPLYTRDEILRMIYYSKVVRD
jgi:hypothetical protein